MLICVQECRFRYKYAFGTKKIRPRQKDVDESQTKSLIRYLYKYCILHLLNHVLHVAHDHHRDLKCQRIIKFPDIQTGALLQLLQPIYERIPVNIQLTRGLR